MAFGKLPHTFYLRACFVHGVVIDSGVMKLQVESLNVFLKSITQNVMPRWARVWEYNYDQFECWGRPFWISPTQRQWVPLTRRAHKSFICICAYGEIEHTQNKCTLCNSLTSRQFWHRWSHWVEKINKLCPFVSVQVNSSFLLHSCCWTAVNS